MTYDMRKILYYGVTGVLVAVVLSALVSSSPTILQYVLPGAGPKVRTTGTLIVKVTDAPVPDLKNLNLTIDQVAVLNKTGHWITLDIAGDSKYFDLLKLQNVTEDLAIGEIPAGNYTKIRMRIVSANATLGDGSEIDLNVPPGHADIRVDFEIKPGEETTLIIDIIVDKIMIAERGMSGKPANLNPQFKAIVVPPE